MVKNPQKPSSKKGAMRESMKAFKMRKASIFKKAHELSVLCGVDVGVVIFGPDHQDSTTAIPIPHVWPQTPQDLHNIIAKYQSTNPEAADHQNNNNNNYHLEVPVEDLEIERLSVDQLVNLVGCLDSKLAIVEERIGFLKSGVELMQCQEQQSVEDYQKLAAWEKLLLGFV